MKNIINYALNVSWLGIGLSLLGFAAHGFIVLWQDKYMEMNTAGLYFSAFFFFFVLTGALSLIYSNKYEL